MDPVHGQLGPGLAVDLQPPAEFEPFVRPRRRLTIDQVNASLLAVTGGLTWTLGNNQANQFEALSTTLGVPDYIQVVQEDLAPGAIFQKFLGDAARSVCTQLVTKELASTPGERVLMVHAGPDVFLEDDTEAVEMNLRMLVLRYHGYLANENDPALETWRWLFESVSHVSQSPAEGWRAVCISLITHPDFYLH
jgi:hypothetical protein